jgi:hypothetical protein
MITRLALVAGLLTAVSAHAQMSLPGKFEVTDTGSASYTIPVSIVPGTAGLEPRLSLQYDSRSGNGLLGVGWGLAGLPAITRCGRTIAQDGQAGGVAYDANDRFCLDGQRLIAISGTYGADGTEYRTERESFSKVVSYGTAGSGPNWFRVWTKAGLVMEFGNTADSRIEAQGKASVRVWALNKTSDTKSNYFTVSYIEDNANGEYRPDRIDYTGNSTANAQPENSVRFVYETRPDIIPMYQAGSLIKTTKRMTKVQAWQSENSIREYRISYDAGAATQRSRLFAFLSCDAQQSCLPETKFTWSGQTVAGGYTQVFHQSSAAAGPFWMPSTSRTYAADVNGDGRTDIIQIESSNYRAQVLISNGDGTYNQAFYQPNQSGGPFWDADYAQSIPLDANGDGLSDILQVSYSQNAHYAQVLLSNGDGTFRQAMYQVDGPFLRAYYSPGLYTETFVFDGNADGISDAMQINPAANFVNGQTANGNGTYAAGYYQTLSSGPFVYTNASANTIPLDYNGDGKGDFIQIRYASPIAIGNISVGSGVIVRDFFQDSSANGPFWSADYAQAVPLDVNGDGMSDVLQLTYSQAGDFAQTLLSNGKIFHQAYYQTSGPLFRTYYPSYQYTQTYVVEYDGDGKSDIVQLSHGANAAHLLLSNGDGTFRVGFQQANLAAEALFWRADATETIVIDYDGDGRSDFLQVKKDSAVSQILRPVGLLPDQLTGVETGLGGFVQISYRPIASGGSLYSRDAGTAACAYPCVDVQGPLYVVSEVKSSNGLGIAGAGGEYRSTYRYAGAKSDLHGRGFLGFHQMTVRDEQTGVEQTTTYRQDYPFTGLVAAREKKLGTQLLNRSSNTYGSTDLGGTRRYPFLTQSLEESWELTGAALPAVTTAYQYDAFGNANQVGISTGDGHSKVTNNAYSNDAASWLLGRLTRSEVTSTTPGN